MKPNKGFRPANSGSEADDTVRKAVKLAPIKKSGKDRHTLYNSFDDGADDEKLLDEYRKKESALDYFDDGEE